jgi:hypothetical protein
MLHSITSTSGPAPLDPFGRRALLGKKEREEEKRNGTKNRNFENTWTTVKANTKTSVASGMCENKTRHPCYGSQGLTSFFCSTRGFPTT